MAARDGHARIAELLLEAGASPNAPELVMRSTPGHKAAVGGHCDVLGLLLRHGYEIDVQGPYNGYTALHDAAWFGHAEAALVLLAGNARADLRGHDGRTPADIAIEDGYPKVAAVLARHGGTR
jgi:ankyrin repeat protein